MIPRILDEWNLSVIVDLLQKGYYETEYFDFKEKLPNKNDERGKKRLIKACCAFANSIGGFLVFGINDKKEHTVTERLIGIDPTVDFPEHFGNFPQSCTPSVEWDFKNPAITLENGNAIHVIHVFKSWNMPHAYGDQYNNWSFPKRTNKGDELMNFDEIRMSFLGYYEKRLKLNLLKSEINTIKEQAQSMIIDRDKMESSYSLVTFDLSVVESILSDTYIVIAKSAALLQLLTAIRTTCRTVNNKQSIFYSTATLAFQNKNQVVKEHNQYLHINCPNIISYCSSALQLLESLVGF